MATNFPTSIDSYSTKVDNVDSVLASHVNDLQSAVVAIETKVGVDSSAVTNSHDYLLTHLPSQASAASTIANLNADKLDSLDAADFVRLTGSVDQSVTGIKTFGSIPVLPASDPTTANQATRKTYVDNYFDTSTGHDHDGSDSKKVLATNLDVTGITDGYYLKRSGSTIVGSTITGSGYSFVSSSTFTASTSVTVSDAPSSGEVYQIVFEGKVNTAQVNTRLRVNGGSGSSYHYTGVYVSSASATPQIHQGSSDTEIDLQMGSDAWSIGVNYIVDCLLVNVGGGKAHLRITETVMGASVSNGITWTGACNYEAAAPTSLVLAVSSGSGTLTGRYYVYKLSQS